MREVASLEPAFSARIAGLIHEEERARVIASVEGVDPCVSFALQAAREANAMAGESGFRASRVGLVFGTSMGSHETRMRYNDLHEAKAARMLAHQTFAAAQFGVETALVADALGIQGPRLTISTACTSSTQAIGLAREFLHEDLADRVFVIGSDPFAMEVFAGFYTLGVMSASPCAPFGEPVGMNVGEGAGALVLERQTDAVRRGATLYAALRGYGMSVDAFHPTTPEPAGKGVAQSIREALCDASLEPQDIGYYNAHGTGTASNDAAEWKAIQQVFAERAAMLPISSTKSYLGHAQGAAGILEAIATIMALREQVCLPTLHLHTKRRQAPDDPIASEVPRPCSYNAAISHNSAFGGLNATLVFSHPTSPDFALDGRDGMDHKASTATVVSGPTLSLARSIAEDALSISIAEDALSVVYVLGVGSVTAHGTGGILDALREGKPLKRWPEETRWLASEHKQAGFVPKIETGGLLRRGETRGMDDISRYLTMASAAALQDAGIAIRGDLRERTGLFAGVSRIPAESCWRFLRIARERGWHRAPAHEFARLVLNAPAGACSLALALRGAGTTLVGAGSGLMAAIYGVWWLRSRPDTEVMLVAGCDELGDDDLREHENTETGPFLSEGAGVVVLANAQICKREGIVPQIAVRAVSVIGTLKSADDGAIREALGSWMLRAGQPDAIFWAGSSDAKISLFQEIMSPLYGPQVARIPVWQTLSVLGYARAASSSWALVGAVESMRQAYPQTTNTTQNTLEAKPQTSDAMQSTPEAKPQTPDGDKKTPDATITEKNRPKEHTNQVARTIGLFNVLLPWWGCDAEGKPPRCVWVITEDALCGVGLLSLFQCPPAQTIDAANFSSRGILR